MLLIYRQLIYFRATLYELLRGGGGGRDLPFYRIGLE